MLWAMALRSTSAHTSGESKRIPQKVYFEFKILILQGINTTQF
jgi:hypothetical protein